MAGSAVYRETERSLHGSLDCRCFDQAHRLLVGQHTGLAELVVDERKRHRRSPCGNRLEDRLPGAADDEVRGEERLEQRLRSLESRHSSWGGGATGRGRE